MEAEKDSSGVPFPPPLVYVAGWSMGLAIHVLVPLRFPWGTDDVARVLIGISITLALWVVHELRKAGTTVRVDKPTSALVTSGPFYFTRNPIYLSFSLAYAGFSLQAGSAWTLLMLAPIMAAMEKEVIAREESYLEEKFGEEYLRYKARVRRWL